jgi:hypothetical protein
MKIFYTPARSRKIKLPISQYTNKTSFQGRNPYLMQAGKTTGTKVKTSDAFTTYPIYYVRNEDLQYAKETGVIK